MITELEARKDARKSFYGKARVEIKEDGTEVLWSYSTQVILISPQGEIKVLGKWSQTTTRHQKEFLYQRGYNDKEIKMMLNNPNKVFQQTEKGLEMV